MLRAATRAWATSVQRIGCVPPTRHHGRRTLVARSSRSRAPAPNVASTGHDGSCGSDRFRATAYSPFAARSCASRSKLDSHPHARGARRQAGSPRARRRRTVRVRPRTRWRAPRRRQARAGHDRAGARTARDGAVPPSGRGQAGLRGTRQSSRGNFSLATYRSSSKLQTVPPMKAFPGCSLERIDDAVGVGLQGLLGRVRRAGSRGLGRPAQALADRLGKTWCLEPGR